MNYSKFFVLIALLAFLSSVQAATSSTTVCSNISFKVTSDYSNGTFTVSVTDQNGYIDGLPPPKYFGTSNANAFEDLNIFVPAGVNLISSNNVSISHSTASYSFDMNNSTTSFDVNFKLTDVNSVLPLCDINHTVEYEADLNAGISPSVSGTQTLGVPFTFGVLMTNKGAQDANHVVVSLNPSTSTVFDSNVSAYAGFQLAGSNASNSRHFNVNPLTCGSTSLGAIVTYQNLNGTPKPSVSISKDFNFVGPNLRVSDLTFNNSNPIDGNIVRISAVIQNTGDTNISTPFDVNFLNSQGQIDKNTVSSLDANSSVTVSIDWNTSNKTGNHVVKVVADGSKAIAECSETNNDLNQLITVQPSNPGSFDLNAVSFTASSSSITVGSSVTLTAVFKSQVSSVIGVTVKLKEGSTDLNSQSLDLTAGQEKTLTYSITPSSVATHTYTFSLDPENSFNESSETDNNLSVSVVVNAAPSQNSGGGTTNPPAPGGSPTTPLQPKTTIELETNKEVKVTPDSIKKVLEEINVEKNSVALEALNNRVEFSRDLKVEKTVQGSKESFASTIGVSVSNPGTEILKNVKVVEVVPKEIAFDANELSSSFEFIVLKSDPVIQFIVKELKAGETVKLSYTVKKKVTQEAFNLFAAPLVVDLTLPEKSKTITSEPKTSNLCESISCNDNNPCTIDSCNSSNGTCSYSNEVNGISCADNKVCSNGSCVAIELKTPPTGLLGLGGIENTALGIGAVLLLLITGYYLFTVKRKKKNR